ncbi:MAG: tellurite methyltransferase [Flavobacteriales bacterium]|jgi:tellurite methyltransferase
MIVTYDKYYQTENLFGEPYPELVAFFAKYPQKGKVLDLGCEQGRDSIPLARMGFKVTAMDSSSVGIEQLNQNAKAENLGLKGIVADIFELDSYSGFDFVLLDSMFHFAKKDRKKETAFVQKLISMIDNGCLLVFCIEDTGKKAETLNDTTDHKRPLDRVVDQKFKYEFQDGQSGHTSTTNYRMIAVKK